MRCPWEDVNILVEANRGREQELEHQCVNEFFPQCETLNPGPKALFYFCISYFETEADQVAKLELKLAVPLPRVPSLLVDINGSHWEK